MAQRSLDLQYQLLQIDTTKHAVLRTARDAALRGVLMRVRLPVDDLSRADSERHRLRTTLIPKSFKLTIQLKIMNKSFKQTMLRAGAQVLLAATMMTVLSAQAAEPSKLSDNKATVVAFYEKALNDKDADAAIAMMGPTYTQHNARVPDGKEGFRQFIAAFKQRYPASHSRIVRVIAEGDLVVLHVHLVREPGTTGDAVMDIFRLADGKIVEHWDVIQQVPEKIPHANTMF